MYSELWGTLKNILGDQGSIKQNFWEQGNLIKVNFREHSSLIFGEQGRKFDNFFREQGSMHLPPPASGGPHTLVYELVYNLSGLT